MENEVDLHSYSLKLPHVQFVPQPDCVSIRVYDGNQFVPTVTVRVSTDMLVRLLWLCRCEDDPDRATGPMLEYPFPAESYTFGLLPDVPHTPPITDLPLPDPEK